MKQRHNVYGYGFLGVSFLGLLFFYVMPLFYGGWQVFIEYGMISFSKGVRIYRDVFESITFRLALKNTISLILCCIPTLLVLAISITWHMDCKRKHRKNWNLALWLIPYIIPSVIVVQIIRLIFGKDGLLAFTNVSFLDSEWTFYLLCFIFLWRNSGYIMVILLSGCSNISDEQREAAQLDGAGSKGVFWHIILPQLMPFIKFSVVMGVIGCFRLYRESYLLLGNQPCDEAYMLQNFLNNNFESWNFDRAVAASLILFGIMAIVWLILFIRVDREKEAAWKRY